jgi:hypothetical protein
MIDAFVRAAPREWPSYVRYLESKARHRAGASGISPYHAWHGFAGSSALASSLLAFEEIPEALVHTDWLTGIREEAKKIEAQLNTFWSQQAATRARKLQETKPVPKVVVGDLCLITKPFWERGGGLILPQADGPFQVDRVFDDHTCSLVDALTQLPFQSGQRISLARVIRFDYPTQCVNTDDTIDRLTSDTSALLPNQLVAAELKIGPVPRVYVARVIRTFPANGQL